MAQVRPRPPHSTLFLGTHFFPSFMGGNAFCLKACDPAGPNAANYCQHIYDRIGCGYNAPNNAQNGTFEACKGENQDFPGVYTTNGAVVTYTQPSESLGAITTMPYTARIPASSDCTTYTSSVLYTSLAAVSAPSQSTTTSTSGTSKPTTTPSKGTSSGSSGPKTTSGSSSDASTLAVGGVATLLGVAFSALFLA